ncbi:hypothetical protein C8F01DRAFT_1241946 [Mycena amicta]|nr:hypothetical protein C8F01DRAFT_1241946 [Mycena amicta]
MSLVVRHGSQSPPPSQSSQEGSQDYPHTSDSSSESDYSPVDEEPVHNRPAWLVPRHAQPPPLLRTIAIYPPLDIRRRFEVELDPTSPTLRGSGRRLDSVFTCNPVVCNDCPKLLFKDRAQASVGFSVLIECCHLTNPALAHETDFLRARNRSVAHLGPGPPVYGMVIVVKHTLHGTVLNADLGIVDVEPSDLTVIDLLLPGWTARLYRRSLWGGNPTDHFRPDVRGMNTDACYSKRT